MTDSVSKKVNNNLGLIILVIFFKFDEFVQKYDCVMF